MRIVIWFHPDRPRTNRQILGEAESVALSAWKSMKNYPSARGIAQGCPATFKPGKKITGSIGKELIKMGDVTVCASDTEKIIVVFEFCRPRSFYGKTFKQDLVRVLGIAFGGRFGINVRPKFSFPSIPSEEDQRGYYDAVV